MTNYGLWQGAGLVSGAEMSSTELSGSQVGPIVLSYRRDDAKDLAGRLKDRVVQQFGAASPWTDGPTITIDFATYPISKSRWR